MPVESGLEDRWKYFVPQPIPDDAVESAPDSIARAAPARPRMRLGPLSGHRLRLPLRPLPGRSPPPRRAGDHFGDAQAAIARSILENNLFGIDIDARCIQIAAAALYLKGKRRSARDLHLGRLNLVAPDLPLARLPEDDPALVEFRTAVTEETGIRVEFVDELLDALKEAYHLGSLLKVEDVIGEAMRDWDARALDREQQGASDAGSSPMTRRTVRGLLLDRLQQFLARHTGRRRSRPATCTASSSPPAFGSWRCWSTPTYDVVVANPPYSGTSNLAVSDYVKKEYKRGKADLYAAFLERGLQLVRKGGVSAMVTMRGWMFIKQYEKLRKHLAKAYDIRAIGDLDTGAFEEISGHVVSSILTAIWNEPAADAPNVATNAGDRRVRSRTQARRTARPGRPLRVLR